MFSAVGQRDRPGVSLPISFAPGDRMRRPGVLTRSAWPPFFGERMSEVAHTVRVATHESGHAVCARLLHLPDCGGAYMDPARAIFSLDHGAHSVCALMGGAIAEVVMYGDYDRVGIRVDWKRARRRMTRLGYRDNGQSLWDYTHGLLLPHRGTIAVIALRLLAAGGLEAAEIDALMGADAAH